MADKKSKMSREDDPVDISDAVPSVEGESRMIRRLVEFQDVWSKEEADRKGATEQANEWLAANEDKQDIIITPLFGNSKTGYYVTKVVIDFKEEVKA